MNGARRQVVLAVLLTAGAGCKASEPPAAPEDRVVVFAAASLRDAFGTLAGSFEAAHPGVEVTFNFAGTQELRAQLEQGAAVDVFASADGKHLGELVKSGRVTGPVVFARNEPVVVVAKDSVASLKTLADLPTAERIVFGVPDVPIGRYTAQILDKASTSLGPDFRKRVEAHVVSREPNVRQVLAKVSLGEAQAAIVYRTDARAAGQKVATLEIPAALNVIAEYPIAAVTGAAHPKLARAFLDLVVSGEGRRALGEAGFLAPAP